MSEASMVPYGAAIVMAIAAVAAVTFALRGKGHRKPVDEFKSV